MDDNKSDNSGTKAPPVSPKVSNDNDLNTHEESAREKRIRELGEEVTLRLKKVVAGKKSKKMQGEANELIREMKESIERKSHNILLDNIFEREMRASIDSAEKYLSRTISREEAKEEKEKKEAEEKEARERRARIHALEEPESTKAKDSAKTEKGKQVEQSRVNTAVEQPSTTVKRGGFGVPSVSNPSPDTGTQSQGQGQGQTITSPKRQVPPGTSMRDRHASSRTNAHTEKPDSTTTKQTAAEGKSVVTNSAGIVNHHGKQINLVSGPQKKLQRKLGSEPPIKIQLPKGMGIRKPIPFRAPFTSYETIEDHYETADERPFGNTRSDQPGESGYTSRGDAIGGGSAAGSMSGPASGGSGGSHSGGGASGGGNDGGGGGGSRGRNPHIKRGGLGNRKAGHKSPIEKLEKNLEKKIRNEAIKRVASSLFLNPYFWAVVGIILLILLVIAIISHNKSGAQDNPLKVMKTGPTQAKLNDTLVYNITVTYPGSADNVTISDPLPQGTTYVSSNPPGTLNGTTVTWDAKALNLPLANPISLAVTLTLKATQDNLKIGNVASATVTGGTAGSGGGAGYVAPNNNICIAYQLTNPLHLNFGDPNCDFTKNRLYTQLKQEDPANADVWFNKVIPCESGFNPNAYAGPQTGTPDARGAWGLFQMGSASPPGSPPPAPGKNGINDRGDVPWGMQADNATTYGKKLGSLGAYWACAR